MSAQFTPVTRRFGVLSAVAVVVLELVYAVTLVVGLSTLESDQHPIEDAIFSILEVLILVMTPALVTLMVAVHGWAPDDHEIPERHRHRPHDRPRGDYLRSAFHHSGNEPSAMIQAAVILIDSPVV